MTCSFAELSTWSDIYRIRKAQFPILRLFLRLMGKLFTRCIASTRRVVFVSRQFPTEWARVTMNLRPKISWMRMGSKLSHSTHLADITWHSQWCYGGTIWKNPIYSNRFFYFILYRSTRYYLKLNFLETAILNEQICVLTTKLHFKSVFTL